MIVTIDGPAGAGKSSAARALAQRLGFAFLDTGAMYRAVTLAALRGNCDRADQTALAQLMAGLRLDMPGARVVLNGEDVTGLIRTPEITAASGAIASSPVVRGQLVAWQRQIAAAGDFVCEGRDQGTIVFPDALCKFFLFADPLERARRRHRELTARGENITLDDVLKAQDERDARDAARDIAPMVPAKDAIQLDTTALAPEQVVERMEQEVRTRIAARHPLPPPRSPLAPRPSPLPPRPSPIDSWMDSFWFRAWHQTCYAAYFWSLTLGFSLRMQGERNMPKHGPALLIANHQSFLDPILCGLIARRPMVYLARKTLFTNRFGAAIIRSLNAVPRASARRACAPFSTSSSSARQSWSIPKASARRTAECSRSSRGYICLSSGRKRRLYRSASRGRSMRCRVRCCCPGRRRYFGLRGREHCRFQWVNRSIRAVTPKCRASKRSGSCSTRYTPK
jgi:cytidylate kinase